jgi:NTP pyrophosphatase (non-canonical NTP hydrolase)
MEHDMESPINKLQQLMTITMEECGELTQQCSKIIRKYKDFENIEDDQREKLLEELGDVYCMIDLMCEHGVVDWKHIYARSSAKKDKLKIWSDLT